jgi:error-prone DNA polymerase
MSRYAELAAASNFSFLRAASHPEELVQTAAALGLEALGIADRNSVAGVVRAWAAGRKREAGPRVLAGTRLVFADGTPDLICYPQDRAAWGRLTRLLTLGKRRARKGGCDLALGDFLDHAEGLLGIVLPPAPGEAGGADFPRRLEALARARRGSVWLGGVRRYGPRDLAELARLEALGAAAGAPLVAVGEVLYHDARRRPLQDVLTCIREGCTIHEAGLRLEANAERRLKSPAEMARLFARFPGAVERSLEIAGRVGFDLSELRYEYPDEPVPPGKTPIQHLRDLTWEGAAWRFEGGLGERERRTLEHELGLIEKLGFPNYFLTVHDIVRWAREQGILCQGRGSAANSVVCFCLGITAVDPTKKDQDLLFSRFISEARGEPPDIDVDFEHERREEVMQYLFRRYGRERAAIAATVIHFRPRMAIRQVGKALGLTEDVTAALAGTVWGPWGGMSPDPYIRQAGLDPDAPEIRRATTLASELLGFPRHLSQHVGGYVLTRGRLDEMVPIGNAAMPDRTFIEWDKDDIDALGLMKVDILALGMLSALRKSFAMIPPRADGTRLTDIAQVPQEVPQVYDMLCRADSVGVFQVESRAQMSMLPRLKPRRFYDLVIEVAIVRPGPIQGDMVHPYLRRRDGTDPVEFPAPAPEHGPPDELHRVLGKTLGVPLFQEQAMRLAIEAARFSENDADGLRRAMATFRNLGSVSEYRRRFLEGMTVRGYDPDFAERCFRQIEGFGSYGFPESHAISFALLVYASAWVKWRWPDAFCAALINSQPMGFYQPAQLVRDAQAHGVEVRPADVLASDWDCTLEPVPGRRLRAMRLGLRQVRGLAREDAARLLRARDRGARAVADFAREVSGRGMELLAEADAFAGLGVSRRQALWAVKGLTGADRADREAPLAAGADLPEPEAALPIMTAARETAEDYRTLRLSLKAHPCAFLRGELAARGAKPAAELGRMRDGRRTAVAGLVLVRQRPGTAKGVVFMTLEDETGGANIIVWKDVFEAHRPAVMRSGLVLVEGRLQVAGQIVHLVAERITDLSFLATALRTDEPGEAPPAGGGRLVASRDFH